MNVTKARRSLLQNINWNSRDNPLEQHASSHWTALDYLNEYHAHTGTDALDQPQRVEYFFESITSQDTAFQAVMGNIRADSHGLRENFENASSH
mmetsp:Transcript_27527/g.26381  ORF Transcript_27527/g.26381 Transcript_27527/m.26381 type:complete len:94 (+) Transcript_27527:1313-1594(+)|eukprot:CAMPEP_0197841424 /NCGR_PEP_ID=MMETSP1437-20131217/46168_1 /TAXON_ID=49252 ORGANISM="Eucampia antarctica, Strain CCMP1452" /NCGR_SAMPLE_ID=MMETSP1437 /ASSEMBLY_ACC=CAM_ASM_001096 /LENGTH=93 /DNA_ID=CAMNT_0043451175 /DNA_START=1312 /DNA_END=1593 /DNA_ORIENTATION=-